MEDVLVHELSHAFVDEMSGGRAGRDLQEGLAQYMEGKRIEEELEPAELKRLATSGQQTVMNFYMLSLVVSQQLVQSRGQGQVNDLLRAMKEAGSEEAGYQKVFGRSGAAMQARHPRDLLASLQLSARPRIGDHSEVRVIAEKSAGPLVALRIVA
jgi:hypothetical protein